MKNMRTVLHDILGNDLSPNEVVRAARIKSGLSQEDLSYITGIARPNLSAIENGRLELTFHYALIFGAALNIHPSKILFPNDQYEKTTDLIKIEKRAETVMKKKASS
jgi:transcriptional regulator with XRE-family HTH domain